LPARTAGRKEGVWQLTTLGVWLPWESGFPGRFIASFACSGPVHAAMARRRLFSFALTATWAATNRLITMVWAVEPVGPTVLILPATRRNLILNMPLCQCALVFGQKAPIILATCSNICCFNRLRQNQPQTSTTFRLCERHAATSLKISTCDEKTLNLAPGSDYSSDML
jgi:hypothetical protein